MQIYFKYNVNLIEIYFKHNINLMQIYIPLIGQQAISAYLNQGVDNKALNISIKYKVYVF